MEVGCASSCLHPADRRHICRCVSVSYVFANQTSPTASKIVAVRLGSSGVAGLSSIPLALFGNRVVWLGLLIIGVLITGIGGVLIGLLGSAEGISTKAKDDFARKRGDDQWYGGWGG